MPLSEPGFIPLETPIIKRTEILLRLPVRCLEIASIDRSHSEMERIGVDPAGIRIMAPKHFHYNIKLEGLTPAQANIIKQEMLSMGGDAAVARGVASCSVERSGAILSGTLAQFTKLAGKLNCQPFGLPALSERIALAIENSRQRRHTVVSRAGREWTLGERTLIMGILNVTPDSFSDGGKYLDVDRAVERAVEMASQGADWIDVGGESTRPGAAPVDTEEELKRVVPVVERLADKGLVVSVDTTKARVAEAALKAGAEIINDVSALSADAEMAGVCAAHGAPVVLMHMRGTPLTMQKDTAYADLVGEVFNYLAGRMDYALKAGVGAEKIIIDPGIGFGKTAEDSLEIISRLSEFRSLGRPILVGPSRKSFIGAVGGASGAGRLSGTIAASVASILKGVSVLRVHDVAEAKQASLMADAINNAGKGVSCAKTGI